MRPEAWVEYVKQNDKVSAAEADRKFREQGDCEIADLLQMLSATKTTFSLEETLILHAITRLERADGGPMPELPLVNEACGVCGEMKFGLVPIGPLMVCGECRSTGEEHQR